ncbi:MAG: hypothetical protein A2542_03085 [Parcubacteria group bacterium RIFOXYD2_FULL_52_8]|nr:MAG: hypothetical protein A2542_03085 [Parcubacteria group bacterium RIFOXYD2_FULL_52_8]
MHLEEKARQRFDVKRVLLTTLATAGLLSVAVLAPNAVQMIAKLGMLPNKYNRTRYFRSAIGRLERQGLIRLKKKGQHTFAELTPKGSKELQQYKVREYIESHWHTKRKWDKRWRVVIFDIKEFKRYRRDQLRKELYAFGFVKIQQSVWVYPYECEEFVTLLKTHHELGTSVLYMIVQEIEHDIKLRQAFGLPNE